MTRSHVLGRYGRCQTPKPVYTCFSQPRTSKDVHSTMTLLLMCEIYINHVNNLLTLSIPFNFINSYICFINRYVMKYTYTNTHIKCITTLVDLTARYRKYELIQKHMSANDTWSSETRPFLPGQVPPGGFRALDTSSREPRTHAVVF